MRISLCQTATGADKSANLAEAIALLKTAASDGCDVAVLPECLDYLGPEDGVVDAAEVEHGPFSSAIADQARALGIWVIGGTIRVRDDSTRVSNTLIVYNPQGVRTAIYRKMHMFDVSIPGGPEYIESRMVKPGSDVVVTAIAGNPSGLSICYDLRFPELFRLQALAGAKILFIPAAFTTHTGRDHWEVLLRARAIENQCFVVAVDQFGNALPGIPLYGRSMVIDPWGTVIACAPDGTGVTTVSIDLNVVEAIRERLPALRNRRDDIYSVSKTGS